LHERQLRAREVLTILDQPAAATEPPEGSLDNPPLRNHHEAFDCVRTFDNLQNYRAGPFRGRGCFRAAVGAISKQVFQDPNLRRTLFRSGRKPSRSCTSAGVTSSPSIRPSVSTMMCRFLPLTFLAASEPIGSMGLPLFRRS
jgi:hypothetical protein